MKWTKGDQREEKRWSDPVLEFLQWNKIDRVSISPVESEHPLGLKKPWHQKGGLQLDSELSGGPWALKMEILTECTVCAILKMSSDNSSFETGVGILWLMCTWAFQVLYSRAWQTSVATWPGVRDIWMLIWVGWSTDWTKSQISYCSYSAFVLSV